MGRKRSRTQAASPFVFVRSTEWMTRVSEKSDLYRSDLDISGCIRPSVLEGLIRVKKYYNIGSDLTV
jgi:hypothetical protein